MQCPSINVCGLPHSPNFFHMISQTTRISRRRYWTQNVCFGLVCSFVRKISHSKKNPATYCHERTHVPMSSNPHSSQTVFKLELFFPHRFSKNTQISDFLKFRRVGTEMFCGRTDGQTGMARLTAAFCNIANGARGKWINYTCTLLVIVSILLLLVSWTSDFYCSFTWILF